MFRKHDLFTNLLDKRCVFVLLDFCSNSFNIHPCNIHKRSLQWQTFLISHEALRPDETQIHYIWYKLETSKRFEITSTKGTRCAALNDDTFDSWIRFPFVKEAFILQIHFCYINKNQPAKLSCQIELTSEPDYSSQSQFEFSNIIPKGQSSPNKTDVT